jgi:hypothetical protein
MWGSRRLGIIIWRCPERVLPAGWEVVQLNPAHVAAQRRVTATKSPRCMSRPAGCFELPRVDTVLDELPWLTAHLGFPRKHWRRIRHTNLIERT